MEYRCAQQGFNTSTKQGYRHSLEEKSIPYVLRTEVSAGCQQVSASSPKHYKHPIIQVRKWRGDMSYKKPAFPLHKSTVIQGFIPSSFLVDCNRCKDIFQNYRI